jgi:hypothetical protein
MQDVARQATRETTQNWAVLLQLPSAKRIVRRLSAAALLAGVGVAGGGGGRSFRSR